MLPLHYLFFSPALYFLFTGCFRRSLVPVCLLPLFRSLLRFCACLRLFLSLCLRVDLEHVYPGGLSFWGFRSLSEQLNSNVVQTREHLKCYPIGYRPRYAPQGCFFMSLCAHDSSPASSGDFSPTASALWFIQNQQTTFGIYSALLPPNRQHIELGRAFSSSLAGKVDL